MTTTTKLIKKSQVAGLARSSGSRRSGTRLHVEEACRQVYRTRRPAVDSVLKEGAGRFARASVEKPERHGHVLKLWQRTWDEEHPEEAARFAAQKEARSAKVAQVVPPPPPVGGGGDARAVDQRVAAQLEAALVEIERLERQHLMDVERVEELELSLRRAREERRQRLPRRFPKSGDDTTRH